MSPCCCNKLPGTWWLQTVFTFVLFQVHRSEVQSGSHWAKIKGVGRVVFLLEILGENPLPCLFQLLEATDIPGEWSPPPSSKSTASYFSPSDSCFQFSTRAFSSHTFVRTEWTLRWAVNLGWSWCVYVGSSIVTNVPSGRRCWWRRRLWISGKRKYIGYIWAFCSVFAVNPKTAFKN